MPDGWVKLWRKSIDSGLIRNHNVWIFWTYCLLKSNHEKDYKQVVGFQEIILQPGQFVFGRKIASKETGLSEQKIRTCLVFLKKCKNLTIKSTNKFSIISIINWYRYQSNDQQINQQTNQHVTSRQPASNHKQEPKNQRTKEKRYIYTSNFLQFWDIYPKQTGKGEAFKSYKNIREPKPTLEEITLSIEKHKKSDQWKNKKFIPNPSTWLNQRRWEDNVDTNSFDVNDPCVSGTYEPQIQTKEEIEAENRKYGI